jgi:hypothetical protein
LCRLSQPLRRFGRGCVSSAFCRRFSCSSALIRDSLTASALIMGMSEAIVAAMARSSAPAVVPNKEEVKSASLTWSLYMTLGDEVPSSGSGRFELLMVPWCCSLCCSWWDERVDAADVGVVREQSRNTEDNDIMGPVFPLLVVCTSQPETRLFFVLFAVPLRHGCTTRACRSMSEHVGACRSMSEPRRSHVGATSEPCQRCRSHVGVCRSHVGACRSMSESCRRHVGGIRRGVCYMSEEYDVGLDDESYSSD